MNVQNNFVMEWNKSSEWRLTGSTFCVIVKHWIDWNERNNWNVYAYLYPQHPYFNILLEYPEEHVRHREPINKLWLHGGCSYFKKHYNFYTGKFTSIQFGSDYSHLGDDYFYLTAEQEPREIFMDAEKLFKELEILELREN